MKIRVGFVSNSSSASFVVKASSLTQKQIKQIMNHFEESQKIGMFNRYATKNDSWFISFTKSYTDGLLIEGSTLIDNFNMYYFLTKIGVKPKDIIYTSDNKDIEDLIKDGENDFNLTEDERKLIRAEQKAWREKIRKNLKRVLGAAKQKDIKNENTTRPSQQ